MNIWVKAWSILATYVSNLKMIPLLLSQTMWWFCRPARKLQMLNLRKIFKQCWKNFRRLSDLQLRGKQHIHLLFPRLFYLLGMSVHYKHNFLFPEREIKEESNSISSKGETYGKEASYSPKKHVDLLLLI